MLWVLLGKRLNGLNRELLGDGAIKALLGSAVMGISLVIVSGLLAGSPRRILVVGLILGLVVYGGALFLLRVPEVQTITKALKRLLGQAG